MLWLLCQGTNVVSYPPLPRGGGRVPFSPSPPPPTEPEGVRDLAQQQLQRGVVALGGVLVEDADAVEEVVRRRRVGDRALQLRPSFLGGLGAALIGRDGARPDVALDLVLAAVAALVAGGGGAGAGEAVVAVEAAADLG